MAGNFRKAMGILAKEPDTAKRIPPDSEASQANAQAAANMVQIGFMAFAVSAYIRTSLCPDLQSYSPQPMRLTAPVRPGIAVNSGQCNAVLLKRSKSVLGATQPASLKVVSTQSVFSTAAVSSLNCCWPLPVSCQVVHSSYPTIAAIILTLTLLQAAIKLGGSAPHVIPAVGGQYILHHTHHDFASLTAPHHSIAQGTDQVRHILLYVSPCELHVSPCELYVSPCKPM